MIQYLTTHPWKIIEEGFKPQHHRSSESIFSIGNGRFGQRANHEETYTGPTLQGSYVAGIYYPDKTRVGWWKNGYPEYFAKVLNSINWIGIRVWIDGEELDLAVCSTSNFRRELDMQKGLLVRSFDVTTISGKQARIESIRFCSMADDETAVIRYSVTPLNFDGIIRFTPYLDGDVHNHDSNYDEKFWEAVSSDTSPGAGSVVCRTKKTAFEVAASMQLDVLLDSASQSVSYAEFSRDFYSENNIEIEMKANQTAQLMKYVGLVSSLNYSTAELKSAAERAALRAKNFGFDKMMSAQVEAWSNIWEMADIQIAGDNEAQQAIRFNIFHLNQT